MRSNYKKIGDYVREVKVLNKDLRINDLRGINIDKYFMPSVANTVGTDMSRYKVVKKGQFACNRMHVGRDKRLPISLHNEDESIIVSPAYTVFEIIDESLLNSEYLMMWFSRKEFDREAWFYTDSDVRGGLSLNDLFDIKIPVPSIEKQREIVKEFNIVKDKLSLNKNTISRLENLGNEFYMEYFGDKGSNEEVEYLEKYVELSKKSINPSLHSNRIFSHFSIPSYDLNGIPSKEKGNEIRSSKFVISQRCILISKLNPNFSRVWSILNEVPINSICSTEFQVLIPRNDKYFGFIFFNLKSNNTKNYLSSMATGTSNSHQRVKPDNILKIPICKTEDIKIFEFNNLVIPIIKMIELKKNENVRLEKFKQMLLLKII